MPAGRPKLINAEKAKEIAELFFLAFTDEQVAHYIGISTKTIQRVRKGEYCPNIKKAEIALEIGYRKRIWAGTGNWCGASWFLERKYPTQFAKPEVQLQINTTNQTVNNTLIVTAEVAHQMSARVKDADAKVTELFKRKTHSTRASTELSRTSSGQAPQLKDGNGHSPQGNGK